MRNGFLPQVALKGQRLGQGEVPAPSPAPSSGDGFNGFGGRFFSTMPFFPVFGPSLPFYWNQPYYPPAPPVQPRYICTKGEDEEGNEKFVCEPERPAVPLNPFLQQQPVLFARPYDGRFFF
jgi:hypothetical protein